MGGDCPVCGGPMDQHTVVEGDNPNACRIVTISGTSLDGYKKLYPNLVKKGEKTINIAKEDFDRFAKDYEKRKVEELKRHLTETRYMNNSMSLAVSMGMLRCHPNKVKHPAAMSNRRTASFSGRAPSQSSRLDKFVKRERRLSAPELATPGDETSTIDLTIDAHAMDLYNAASQPSSGKTTSASWHPKTIYNDKKFNKIINDALKTETLNLPVSGTWRVSVTDQKQYSFLREIINLPFTQPDMFTPIATEGDGSKMKTVCMNRPRHEAKPVSVWLSGADRLQKLTGVSGSAMQNALGGLAKNYPAIFKEELNAVLPPSKRDKEWQVMLKLIFLWHGMKIFNNESNPASGIENDLLLVGELNKEMRLQSLQIHMNDIKRSADVRFETIADLTQGYTHSDLAELCSEAVLHRIREKLDGVNLGDGPIHSTVFSSFAVKQSNFERAFENRRPRTIPVPSVEEPNVTPEDIGGLEIAKQQLQNIISSQNVATDQKLDKTPGKGILLYGPKVVCFGGTLSRGGHNGMGGHNRVSHSSLISMTTTGFYFKIEDIFNKAQSLQHCVLFIEEFDSVAKIIIPGDSLLGGGDLRVPILRQLISELEAVNHEHTSSIVLICSTTRPDIICPDILNPGLIDQLIYVPMPDEKARFSIFKALLRKLPTKDVDLSSLVEETRGYSGADLAFICQNAYKLAVQDNIQNEMKCQTETLESSDIDMVSAEPKIEHLHLLEALSIVKPSVNQDELEVNEQFASLQLSDNI